MMTKNNQNHERRILLILAIVGVIVTVPTTGLVFAQTADELLVDCPAYNGETLSRPTTSDYTINYPAVSTGMRFDLTTVDKLPLTEPGIPGVIEICIYPYTTEWGDISGYDTSTGATTTAVGDDGTPWNDASAAVPASQKAGENCGDDDCIHAIRPAGGNKRNIPSDGTTTSDVLVIPFNTAPTKYTVLLHINDDDLCDSLYPNGDISSSEPGTTCFVIPNGPNGPCPQGACPPAGTLSVEKTANPAFTRTYTWTIDKTVDKTIVKQIGGTATFTYTVSVSHGSGTDGGWTVAGTITVTNPNSTPVTGVDLADTVNNGGTCTVTSGTGITVPANGQVVRSYSCTYSSAPSPPSGTNTATATFGSSSEQGIATFDFASVSPTIVDGSVTVTDSYKGSLGTASYTDTDPKTFSYQRIINIPAFDCVDYTNTATFTSTDNDHLPTGSDAQTVTVCGPAKTGALTMGFWQNKNGQKIIKGDGTIGGVCNLTTFLRLYSLGPFQDLSASATCIDVASYDITLFKAANAKGPSMNAMLKAQMLTTALDVYFSDPALGGNKINAPGKIGDKAIDLTMICKMIDSSSGSATCSGTFRSVSSAFGGSSCKTVNQILSYAASQSNFNGAAWYGQVKATQELAKDTFDAINNQVAFNLCTPT